MIRWPAVLVAAALATSAPGAELLLPANARLIVERDSTLDEYAVPTGAYQNGAIPTRAFEGQVRRAVWHVAATDLTALQVMTPFRDQLAAEGYDILLDCRDRECGGFDFRFGIEVFPAPAMQVNLADYRFLSAVASSGNRAISVLVSAGTDRSDIQIVEVSRAGSAPGTIDRAKNADIPAPSAALGIAALERDGFLVLQSVDFDTGTTRLGPGPYPIFEDISDWLRANPGVRIAVVGHTDSVGGLQGNIAISRERARAVRQRLVDAYGVDPSRVDAEGVGYLAPRVSNANVGGRAANRRVEIVLLP